MPGGTKKKAATGSRLREVASGGTTTASRRVKQQSVPEPAALPTDGAFERAAAAFADLKRSLKTHASPVRVQLAASTAAMLQQPPLPPPPMPLPAAPPAALPPADIDSVPAPAPVPQPRLSLSPGAASDDSVEPPLPRPAAAPAVHLPDQHRFLHELGLTDHLLDDAPYAPAPPPPSDTGLKVLRRNVKELYDDARSHMRLERDAAAHVVRLQAETAELQRAFRHLAEVAVEELEELREDVERNAAAVEAVREAVASLQPLREQIATLEKAAELSKEIATEQIRSKAVEADHEKRMACLEEEVRELRVGAAADREALDTANSTVRELNAVIEDKQAATDASTRAVRESLAAIGRRQAAFEVELEALGTAFRRSTLGIAPGYGAPHSVAWGSGVAGEPAGGVDGSGGNGGGGGGMCNVPTAVHVATAGDGNAGGSGAGSLQRPTGSPLLPRARLFGLGLNVDRHAPPPARYGHLQGLAPSQFTPSAPGATGLRQGTAEVRLGGVDPVYAKALAEARRELTERAARAGGGAWAR